MSKNFKRFIFFFLSTIFIILVNIVLSGVFLTVQNNTDNDIQNVLIKYNDSSIIFDNIQRNDSASKYLGKIGEGSTFYISWKNNNTEQNGAEFNVYFYSHETITDIKIILENDSIILYEEDNINKPRKTW